MNKKIPKMYNKLYIFSFCCKHDKLFKVVILFWLNSMHGLLNVRLILYGFYNKFTDLAIQLVASRE